MVYYEVTVSIGVVHESWRKTAINESMSQSYLSIYRLLSLLSYGIAVHLSEEHHASNERTSLVEAAAIFACIVCCR